MSGIPTPGLPPNLSPLITNHPASCAYRVESVHVSVRHWTPEEAEAMARALVARDREIFELRRMVWDLAQNDPWEPPRPAKFDRCPKCHALTQIAA